jgi:hypothetical protein
MAFYGLIVTPIETMFTVESVVYTILTLTYPIWLIFFVTTTPIITNILLAPIKVCFTSSTISQFLSSINLSNHPSSKSRRCYHRKRHLLHHRHCVSHCSRTGCRFQRPSSIPQGGGGCGKAKHNFKWFQLYPTPIKTSSSS